MDDIKKLIDSLEKSGYTVKYENDVYHISGNNIRGIFSEEYYLEMWGGRFVRQFLADSDECFNKWSQAPLAMSIEDAFNDNNKVLEYLEFLRTKEGIEWSSCHWHKNHPKLPRDQNIF